MTHISTIYQTPRSGDPQPGALLNFPASPLSELLAGDDQWLIESCGGEDLNVYYHLLVTYPHGGEYQVILPWLAQEVCPNCQGQGHIYRWGNNNSDYESLECPECLGEGSLSHDSDIRLMITDRLADQKVIRKSRAGRFNARLGQRGDLILHLTWVDELPGDDFFGPTEAAAATTELAQ